MEITDALKIVRVLADGIDPQTGEQMLGAPYQHPQVVRALYVAVGALDEKLERIKRQQRMPENAGKPWSGQEDSTLLVAFEACKNIKDIAENHHRSEGAIRLRLEKLGKIPSILP